MRPLGLLCAAILALMLNAGSDRAFPQVPKVPQGAGPHFRTDGPNADEFGRKEGYSACRDLPTLSKRVASWVPLAITMRFFLRAPSLPQKLRSTLTRGNRARHSL